MKPSFDPEAAIAALAGSDPALAGLIGRVGPLRLEPRLEPPFPSLMRSIVYQQLSGKAAATIHGRLLALLPEGLERQVEALLTLPDETLRAAGVSRAKSAALRDLAAKVADGTVPPLEELLEMPDEEIVSRLVQIRGVGRWTVEMLLIFNLGRPDVLPLHDLGVRNGFQLTYGLPAAPAPAELAAHGERWRPYRSVASWYLWRAVDLARTPDS